MNRLLLTSLGSLFYCGAALVHASVDGPDAEREKRMFFENKIRPLLAEKCYQCHGAEKQRGGLRLDQRGFVMNGGDSGPALVEGQPEASLLIKGIHHTDEDFKMPPKEKLSDEQIKLLEQWVALGAPWPEEEGKAVKVSQRDEHGFTAEDRQLWVLQPLADVTPPEPGVEALKKWVRTDVDRFVAAKYEEKGLTPAPEASPQELIRRLYFDVHGLPPTQAQIQAFVENYSEESYEKLVDEVLASPRYGERWAQHWLDLVRYAESDGYNADGFRSNTWPYRDWVIKAFNDDMPYDQFVRYQLAGDEIAPDDPNIFIATSYLRNGIYEWNQRDVKGQWEIILTDMTDNAGEVFLGLSFGCARCHDHKFDPILQEDYYRLKAFFTPVLWDDNRKLATSAQMKEYEEKMKVWEEATASIRAEMDAMTHPTLQGRMKGAYNRFDDEIRAMMDKPVGERSALEHQLASIAYRQVRHEKVNFNPDSVVKEENKARYNELKAELAKFAHLKPAPLMDAFVATDAKTQPPANVLKTRRGEIDVPAGFLKILEPEAPEIKPTETTTGRRTVLANWITRPDNQLSTRVIVNRVWQYHFGRGIAGTANDLGNMGQAPTHPELLDWMAKRFVSQGWSLKKLHREILLSSVYRQTTRREMPAEYASADPANDFLWRFHPRRLDAEQIRDAMLVTSGEMDLNQGGPSVNASTPRRSIYTIKKRNSQDELLRAMDAPVNFTSIAERQSTTTPTQALYMMNGDWILQRAARLASRAKEVDQAWKLVLGRPLSERERELVNQFIEKRLEHEKALATELGNKQDVPPGPSSFRVETPQERLIYSPSADALKEGDEFTIETVFNLHSIDNGGAVRTIVSRWQNGTTAPEHAGWSLGVTGQASRFSPAKLLLQMVGRDDSGKIVHQLANSDLRVALNTNYHAVVRVSSKDGLVKFSLKNLSNPAEKVQTAVFQHTVRSGLDTGNSQIVVGGLSRREPAHQFHGNLEGARVVRGLLDAKLESADPQAWAEQSEVSSQRVLVWSAKTGATANLAWSQDVPDPRLKVADFKPDSDHERLVLDQKEREGEDFSIETLFTPRTVATDANVKTLVSRWNLASDSLEGFGWSLGVTGQKSRFKPQNLIMQLVGFDENENIAYEVVPSNLFLSMNTSYHVVVEVSSSTQSVIFKVKDLSKPDSAPQVATVKHRVKRGITTGQSQLVVGGLSSRNPGHHFDGLIRATRVVTGTIPPDAQSHDLKVWKEVPGQVLSWNYLQPLPETLIASGKDSGPGAGGPMQGILMDLCHVLLNSNEFLYLH